MNRSIEFLERINELQAREIPGEVLARTRKSLLDYLAVTCAGARFQEEKLKKYFSFAQPENGDFPAIGTGRSLVFQEAVYLNGLNGHALDYDDGTTAGIIHIGSPIFSLLIPLAQKHSVSVEDMIRAAVIGYEASYTMAISIQPGHKALGFHCTGTCGVLGATIAASYMLGFSPEERFNAFAAACVAASGMLKVLDDGSELKPYNVAKSALLALSAIRMGKAGFKGSPDPLGGNRGFFKMMTGREDIELEPVFKNGSYAVMKSYTKPYASCRYTHPSVEAAVYMRNTYSLTAEDIESIDIRTYSIAVAGHDHTVIPSPYSAKMSIPYSTAVGIIYGKAGLQEFTEDTVKDDRIIGLTKKVRVAEDEELSANFPKLQSTVVTIRTTDGREFSERVDYPKGEPENPFTEEEFFDRYCGLMEFGGVSQKAAKDLYDRVISKTAGNKELSDIKGL